jgi:hypothetical protein
MYPNEVDSVAASIEINRRGYVSRNYTKRLPLELTEAELRANEIIKAKKVAEDKEKTELKLAKKLAKDKLKTTNVATESTDTSNNTSTTESTNEVKTTNKVFSKHSITQASIMFPKFYTNDLVVSWKDTTINAFAAESSSWLGLYEKIKKPKVRYRFLLSQLIDKHKDLNKNAVFKLNNIKSYIDLYRFI